MFCFVCVLLSFACVCFALSIHSCRSPALHANLSTVLAIVLFTWRNAVAYTSTTTKIAITTAIATSYGLPLTFDVTIDIYRAVHTAALSML